MDIKVGVNSIDYYEKPVKSHFGMVVDGFLQNLARVRVTVYKNGAEFSAEVPLSNDEMKALQGILDPVKARILNMMSVSEG